MAPRTSLQPVRSSVLQAESETGPERMPGEEVGLVAVVDSLALRRAQLVRFLNHWAVSRSLKIAGLSIDEVMCLDSNADCRLAIIGIASATILTPSALCTLRLTRSLFENAPIVISCEKVSPKAVEIAIIEGSSGFITGDMHADFALATLDFIMSGGTHFPTM